MRQLFYYKVRQVLQSVTILLQSATGITKCERRLLQSATGITKCGNFITKCDKYYKVWATIITKCDRTDRTSFWYANMVLCMRSTKLLVRKLTWEWRDWFGAKSFQALGRYNSMAQDQKQHEFSVPVSANTIRTVDTSKNERPALDFWRVFTQFFCCVNGPLDYICLLSRSSKALFSFWHKWKHENHSIMTLN